MTPSLRRLAWLIALAIALPAIVGAQTLTGSIEGRITDEQGAVLPGVTVTLTGRTGSQSSVTDEQGGFRFVGLDPGVYEVKADLSGFTPKTNQNLDVAIGKVVRADFTLGVGGLSESVDVVASSATVDATSSATDTSLSQELLYNVPISRANAAVELLNYAPGINNGSAYGGEASTGNALLVDGVDTRDPEGGSAWTFFNFNIVEEVQVGGLGANAEYGGFTGAVVNSVTKSGGNMFSGLFDVQTTNDSLGSNNISSDLTRQNPALADPDLLTKLLDYTVQFGGPIVRDKVFFFGSAQRYFVEQDPSGPRTLRKEVSPRLNGKLTFQPTPSDNITATIQYDHYNQQGRNAQSALVSTDAITFRQDSPEFIWNAQWRKVLGSTSFFEVKYTGWTGYYDLIPTIDASGHVDGETGEYSVSAGQYLQYDRWRNQVNASVTKYADAFGRHDFKFGVEVERSKIRNRLDYINDVFFYDYGGLPYLAYNYGYDVEGKNKRESVYAQDAWKIGNRLTLNAGVRVDRIRGGSPALGRDVYSVVNAQPRLGFALDLTGRSESVLKAFYGQYYEGAIFNTYNRAVPGVEDFVTYEVLSNGRLDEIDRAPGVVYGVADDIKHPRVDEFNVSFEQALRRDLRFAVTGIWRENRNFMNSVISGATWQPVTLPNSLAGGAITGYRWANRAQTEENFLITNVKDFKYYDTSGNVIATADPYRSYRSLMFVLTKAMSHRWQAQASYVYSRAEGTVDNTFGRAVNSRQFETPNGLINADGRLTNDRPHEFKLLGTYQIPVVDVNVSAYFRSLSGRTFTDRTSSGQGPYQQYASADLNFPQSSTGRRILLEPRGGRRMERETAVDMRVEKTIPIGTGRLGGYVEIVNLFNADAVIGVISRAPNQAIPGIADPVPFGAPGQILPGRQITIGGRWSF